jgi:hypothetical protein
MISHSPFMNGGSDTACFREELHQGKVNSGLRFRLSEARTGKDNHAAGFGPV